MKLAILTTTDLFALAWVKFPSGKITVLPHAGTRLVPENFCFIPEQIVFKEEQIVYRFYHLKSGTIASFRNNCVIPEKI